jgi:hypothetical protein
MSLKRKLPETTRVIDARSRSPNVTPPPLEITVVPELTSTPTRIIPGSPASEFLEKSSPTQYKSTADNILQCNLAETPRSLWGKRFTLAAMIISVQPIIKTETAIRRSTRVVAVLFTDTQTGTWCVEMLLEKQLFVFGTITATS